MFSTSPLGIKLKHSSPAVQSDEKLTAEDPSELFDQYLDTCPVLKKILQTPKLPLLLYIISVADP
jgi:hypothetical protein